MHKLNEIVIGIGFMMMLIGSGGIMDMYGNIQIVGVAIVLGGCLLAIVGGVNDFRYDNIHSVQSQRRRTSEFVSRQSRSWRKASND